MFILGLVGLLAIVADRALAEDWSRPELKCLPTVTDYDRYGEVRNGLFAVLWWCDVDDGLYTHWYTGRVLPQRPDIVAETIKLAGRDPLKLEQLMTRASTAAETALRLDIEAAHAPRCYVIGGAATAAVITETAQHTAGAAKLDSAGVGIRIKVGTGVMCQDRIAKELDKRYCNVGGATDSKARVIDGDAWAACKIERAPVEGWQ